LADPNKWNVVYAKWATLKAAIKDKLYTNEQESGSIDTDNLNLASDTYLNNSIKQELAPCFMVSSIHKMF
jgi:hypothetical protein